MMFWFLMFIGIVLILFLVSDEEQKKDTVSTTTYEKKRKTPYVSTHSSRICNHSSSMLDRNKYTRQTEVEDLSGLYMMQQSLHNQIVDYSDCCDIKDASKKHHET